MDNKFPVFTIHSCRMDSSCNSYPDIVCCAGALEYITEYNSLFNETISN